MKRFYYLRLDRQASWQSVLLRRIILIILPASCKSVLVFNFILYTKTTMIFLVLILLPSFSHYSRKMPSNSKEVQHYTAAYSYIWVFFFCTFIILFSLEKKAHLWIFNCDSYHCHHHRHWRSSMQLERRKRVRLRNIGTNTWKLWSFFFW